MVDYDASESRLDYGNGEVYEDQEEVSRDSDILYEMLQTIDDELREGSTLSERPDSFKYYFERLFGYPIDKIDDIEELISSNSGETYIEIYNVIRDELVKKYDKYFGIKFEDPQEVALSQLYVIYFTVYVRYVNFLCMCGMGVLIGGDTLNKEHSNSRITADDIIGNYLANEDEFTISNIGDALLLADPGNIDYSYLFDTAEEGGPYSNVVIDNEAFRLRVKYEYEKEGVRYLIELAFNKYIDDYVNSGRFFMSSDDKKTINNYKEMNHL
jgi:hypothetical protein